MPDPGDIADDREGIERDERERLRQQQRGQQRETPRELHRRRAEIAEERDEFDRDDLEIARENGGFAVRPTEEAAARVQRDRLMGEDRDVAFATQPNVTSAFDVLTDARAAGAPLGSLTDANPRADSPVDIVRGLDVDAFERFADERDALTDWDVEQIERAQEDIRQLETLAEDDPQAFVEEVEGGTDFEQVGGIFAEFEQ